MRFGLQQTPYAPGYASGQRSAKHVIDWDLTVAQWAEEFGLHEVYFSEHYTIGQEPSPAPDLMIAAASQRTSKILLGAAAHLLPYHHPVSLAHRLLWLDHMTGGRYIAGVAPGSFPTDFQLFDTQGANAEMMAEALEIILAIWTKRDPFRIEGKYWTVDMPAYTDFWKGPHLKPLQKPHPPLVITGSRPNSPSLTQAGHLGAIPMSQTVSDEVLVAMWDAYSTAAAESGHEPRRDEWRIVRDCVVADSDDEALEFVLNSEMARVWDEAILPNFTRVRENPDGTTWSLSTLLVGDAVPPEAVTVEYLAKNFWLVGSPSTVAEKIEGMYDAVGGFGTLVAFAYDHSENPDRYRRHLELLGGDVASRVSHLTGTEPSIAR